MLLRGSKMRLYFIVWRRSQNWRASEDWEIETLCDKKDKWDDADGNAQSLLTLTSKTH